eukprot:5499307-Pyramimonas_sp.AAC.1
MVGLQLRQSRGAFGGMRDASGTTKRGNNSAEGQRGLSGWAELITWEDAGNTIGRGNQMNLPWRARQPATRTYCFSCGKGAPKRGNMQRVITAHSLQCKSVTLSLCTTTDAALTCMARSLTASAAFPRWRGPGF